MLGGSLELGFFLPAATHLGFSLSSGLKALVLFWICAESQGKERKEVHETARL